MLAQSVPPSHVARLSGNLSDLPSTVYLRLKSQLAAFRNSRPGVRFAYLMGRRSSGDLFFFVDNEPPDSPDYSPPGDPYPEANNDHLDVFRRGADNVVGPVSDRWGRFVSALVPIFDSAHAVHGLALPSDALAMVSAAEEFHRLHGRDRLVVEIARPDGIFHRGDLYAFAYDLDMNFLAHPVRPDLVGQNLLDQKDWDGGTFFHRKIREIALSSGSGWVDYEYFNPANGQIEPKTTFVRRIGDLIVCSGTYRGHGRVLAVLGIDVEASDWNFLVLSAAFPSLLLALVLSSLVFAAPALLAHRKSRPPPHPFLLRRLESFLALAGGLSVSFFLAWTLHALERRDLAQTFAQIAAGRTESVAQTIGERCEANLESLAGFLENNPNPAAAAFERFVSHSSDNAVVQACGWLPRVPAELLPSFVDSVRTQDVSLRDFSVWQENDRGERIPAATRPIHFPVLRIAPPTPGNLRTLGFDFVSEPSRLAAVEEALASRMASCSDPVPFAQEGGAKGIRLLRPVFVRNEDSLPAGMAAVSIKLDATLLGAEPDDAVLLGISLLSDSAPPELLAADWKGVSTPPPSNLSLVRPVAIGGKLFGVEARPGPAFLRLHPPRAGLYSLLLGLLASASGALVVSFLSRRNADLEILVAERTASLQAQQDALRRSEERTRSIVELLPDAVFQTDPDGTYLDVFAATDDMLFLPRAQLLGRKIGDVLPPAQAAPIMDAIRESIRSRCLQTIEYDLSVPAGQIHFEARIVPFGARNALILARDVTERKRIESALRESEELFKSLVSDVPGVFFRCKFDPRWTMLFVSPEIETYTGYAADDFIDNRRHAFESIIHRQDSANVFAVVRDAIAANRPWAVDYRIVHRDGSVRWVHETGRAVVFAQGSSRYMYLDGLILDVTERRRMQEEISRNRAFLETLVDSLPIPVYCVDDRERYVLTNRAFEDFFGSHKEELAGKTAFDCYLWNEAQLHHQKDVELFASKSRQTFESQLTDARGGTHDVVFHKAAILASDGSPSGIVGAIQDFTERRRMEAERVEMQSRLMQTGKLEAIGQLAAGVAHEINTPIQFVGDNLSFLRDSFAGIADLLAAVAALPADPSSPPHALARLLADLSLRAERIDAPFLLEEIPRALSDSAEGIQRVRRIVASMRNFSHPDSSEKTLANLNAAVESTAAICRGEWQRVADLRIDLDPSLPEVPCFPGAVNQVILNLLVNAAHAIRDSKGNLPGAPKGSIVVRTRLQGDRALIRVEDDGPGIPERIRPRLFEPFFTTKPVGMGTGQGLFMARNVVVKDHGGEISFETEEGKGTAFVVSLPLHPPART